MRSWIDHSGEVVWEPAPSLIAQLIEAGRPFWLEIENPTDEVIDQLATRLGLHPLVVEDSKQFGQRVKLQVYRDGAVLVGFEKNQPRARRHWTLYRAFAGHGHDRSCRVRCTRLRSMPELCHRQSLPGSRAGCVCHLSL